MKIEKIILTDQSAEMVKKAYFITGREEGYSDTEIEALWGKYGTSEYIQDTINLINSLADVFGLKLND